MKTNWAEFDFYLYLCMKTRTEPKDEAVALHLMGPI